jgi:hypothetical protein
MGTQANWKATRHAVGYNVPTEEQPTEL